MILFILSILSILSGLLDESMNKSQDNRYTSGAVPEKGCIVGSGRREEFLTTKDAKIAKGG